MKEEIINNIIKLRYFKSNITDKSYGDFYVETKEGSYYVFVHEGEISILSHLMNRDIHECILKPTQQFKEEFLEKIKDI